MGIGFVQCRELNAIPPSIKHHFNPEFLLEFFVRFLLRNTNVRIQLPHVTFDLLDNLVLLSKTLTGRGSCLISYSLGRYQLQGSVEIFQGSFDYIPALIGYHIGMSIAI